MTDGSLLYNAFSGFSQDLSDLGLISPSRSIGPYSSSFPLPSGVQQFTPLIAQVTVKETPIDELEITRHPVEQGAAITDHAFKLPAELVLEVGWTNSSLNALVNDVLTAFSFLSGGSGGTFNYVQQIYQQLLGIQLARVPINVVTGKRKYKNMLIRRIMAPTTVETENSLMITMYLQEILVAQTVATNFTDPSVQANPAATQAVQSTGQIQPSITAFELLPDGSVGSPTGLHSVPVQGL